MLYMLGGRFWLCWVDETPLTGTVGGVEAAVLPVGCSGGVSGWGCLDNEGIESIVGVLVVEAEFGTLVEGEELGILVEVEEFGALGEEWGALGEVAELGIVVEEFGTLMEGEEFETLIEGEEFGTLIEGEEFVLGGRVRVAELGGLTELLEPELSESSGAVELSMSSN